MFRGMNKQMRRTYGIDAGANFLKFAEVNPETGDFIGEISSFDLTSLLTDKSRVHKILYEFKKTCPNPKGVGVGICAAGLFNNETLEIIDSPNSTARGVQTFPAELKKAGYDVVLTNDMPAAVQDSARYGEGKGMENVATLTFSEGCNGSLARRIDGRIVNVTQAELGHQRYKKNDSLFCGCGKVGHIEPYVSARGAAAIAMNFFYMTHVSKHPILDSVARRLGKQNSLEDVSSITAKDVYNAWRIEPGQEPQKTIREIQVEAITDLFGRVNSSWAPLDIIVCMGGQTIDKDLLFYGKDGAIIRFQQDDGNVQIRGLKKPVVVITSRKEIGISGAAAYYLSK